ncbi:MAG: GDP-L-fucose synthase [archaeon]
MNKKSKIYVSGHKGLLGSAIVRTLEKKGYTNILTKTHKKLDLENQQEVDNFFEKERPEYVFIAAGKVGGIMENSNKPAEFIYNNTMITFNLINSSYKYKVKKLVNPGSSCIYPRLAPQPIKEEYLLTSPLEKTNEAYAIAKIGAIKLCSSYNKQYNTNYLSVMPCNLYGINDNFNLNSSHVLPAMIIKFHNAKINKEKTITLWGTGKAKREFLYADDIGDAIVYLMEKVDANKITSEFLNIGTGKEITIKQLANLIKKTVGYKGKILWDSTKPDGTPRKVLDVSKLSKLGWKYKTNLDKGIKETYMWFLKNQKQIRK